MRIFDIESPLMKALSKMADLMILNLLTLLCCLPVITVGASLTALNYMSLKIVRNEESYITRGFFRAFKENFKQATAIWFLFMLVAAVLGADYYIVLSSDMEVAGIVRICIWAVSILAVMTFMFVFPAQSKFANPVIRTMKNAFIMSIMQFPKTVIMIALYLIPPVIALALPGLVPIVLLFGLSIPAFLSAKLYNKFFKGLEERVRAENGEEPAEDEDEHIFSDEVPVEDEIGQNNQ